MARKTTKWTVEEEQLWDYFQNNIGRYLEKMGKKKDDIKKCKTCDTSKLVGKISSNDIPKKEKGDEVTLESFEIKMKNEIEDELLKSENWITLEPEVEEVVEPIIPLTKKYGKLPDDVRNCVKKLRKLFKNPLSNSKFQLKRFEIKDMILWKINNAAEYLLNELTVRTKKESKRRKIFKRILRSAIILLKIECTGSFKNKQITNFEIVDNINKNIKKWENKIAGFKKELKNSIEKKDMSDKLWMFRKMLNRMHMTPREAIIYCNTRVKELKIEKEKILKSIKVKNDRKMFEKNPSMKTLTFITKKRGEYDHIVPEISKAYDYYDDLYKAKENNNESPYLDDFINSITKNTKEPKQLI
uniref:Uncharacterized protein n=1 Tax=Strongyloides venezuelensis TaxID=75913 RepID=A0A0K0FZ83_STRVS